HLRLALNGCRGLSRGGARGGRPRRRSPGGSSMNKPARRLGRGLGALIPTEPDATTATLERPRDVFFGADPATGTVPVAEPTSPSKPAAKSPARKPAATASRAEELVEVPGASFAYVPVADIVPNPRQP